MDEGVNAEPRNVAKGQFGVGSVFLGPREKSLFGLKSNFYKMGKGQRDGRYSR